MKGGACLQLDHGGRSACRHRVPRCIAGEIATNALHRPQQVGIYPDLEIALVGDVEAAA